MNGADGGKRRRRSNPCLLEKDPQTSERCDPMQCKRCGWNREEAARRRERVQRWELARGEFVRQLPDGSAAILRLRYLRLDGGKGETNG